MNIYLYLYNKKNDSYIDDIYMYKSVKPTALKNKLTYFQKCFMNI